MWIDYIIRCLDELSKWFYFEMYVYIFVIMRVENWIQLKVSSYDIFFKK